MQWICRACFWEIYPDARQVGLVSKDPQICVSCHKKDICLMESDLVIEELQRKK